LNIEGNESQTKLECVIDELNKDTIELDNAEKDFEITAKELKQKQFESGNNLPFYF